jgi:hypothetical protein
MIHEQGQGNINDCKELPENFSETDLIGQWEAEYFGGDALDILIIREDGKYKQMYLSDWLKFNSTWQNWWFEMSDDGYGMLHLEGMRRCDDIDSICNNPGGGVPKDEKVINPCKNEYMENYDNSILFVLPSTNKEDEFILLHPRLAGSDWTYSFRHIE